MFISIINHTNGLLSDAEVQHAIRAVNRQVREDFFPHWGKTATMRLEGARNDEPQQHNPSDMRGNAVIYLWDKSDIDGAIGYHSLNHAGIPFGFVFVDVANRIGENWTTTLSHEALELIGDPEVNLLAMGPHPADPDRTVFHWYEMCDAVQTETYTIDGVEVSNFVLPLYFTVDDEAVGRNDFLGTLHGTQSLGSFGVNPGGYVGFYDPNSGRHDTYSLPDDNLAATRLQAKFSLDGARRGRRYQRFHSPVPTPGQPQWDSGNVVGIGAHIHRIEAELDRLKKAAGKG